MRRLGLYSSCMALGIAALVGTHGLRATVRDAVDAQAQRLLGADLRLASREPLTPELEGLVTELELRADTTDSAAARVTRFGSMALVPRSGRTRLVDVHAMEGGFPFYGAILTEPSGLWERLQADDHAALVDPSLLIQLDACVGDALTLGRARFQIAGTIARAPGTLGVGTQIAPRVFIARRYVEETRLVRTGSMVDHMVYLPVSEPVLRVWLDAHRTRLESARVRVQTVESYQRELGETFSTLSRYLGLVGLAALLLGAVGIAAGVRVFVREKLDAVAVLRALGARSRDVLACYGLLAIALGFVAGLAGAALGVGFQWLLPAIIGGLLPVEIVPRIEFAAIATGIGVGLWVTALFAIGPLLDLSRVPPLRALRRDFDRAPHLGRGRALLVGALGVSLFAAALWQAPEPALGASFAAGVAGALSLLALAAAGTMAALRRLRLRRSPYWLRQGIANLFRPRNHTMATTIAIGFGLFVVSTLHAVQHNVRRQIEIDARPDRANLVLFDVQSDQVAGVEALLAERGTPILDRAALISARIARLADREAKSWLGDEGITRGLRWALRREYRLTYAAELRATESLVAGRWWDGESFAGEEPVPISLEADIAETLGVEVGDPIDWEIQGVRVETTVQSLRHVDWRRLAVNFFAVFPPGVLEGAPQSTVLLARQPDADARAELQRDLVAQYPNVSALDATIILIALDAMHREMGLAVRVLAMFTLVTGLVILAASAAAARDERTREALLLRTLGASSRTVRRILATEGAALGAVAAGVGTCLAFAAAWAVVRFVFALPFDPPVRNLLAFAVATAVASALLGSLGGRRARRCSPLAALREAEWMGASLTNATRGVVAIPPAGSCSARAPARRRAPIHGRSQPDAPRAAFSRPVAPSPPITMRPSSFAPSSITMPGVARSPVTRAVPSSVILRLAAMSPLTSPAMTTASAWIDASMSAA